MVRVFFCILLIINIAYTKDVFESNCVKCHNKLPVSIDKYFYRYLLKYSGENALKESMYEYLKKPSKEKTIMPEAFINRFGVKKKSKLKDEQLKKAIDIYWEKYKVFGKLK